GQGGGTYTQGQTMNLNASTTYYLVGYLDNIGGGTNLYYNNFDIKFNFSCNFHQLYKTIFFNIILWDSNCFSIFHQFNFIPTKLFY
ncbi:MAG: hypothetical protein VW827_07575, partial [Alphaproteobacteria bacterium]